MGHPVVDELVLERWCNTGYRDMDSEPWRYQYCESKGVAEYNVSELVEQYHEL